MKSAAERAIHRRRMCGILLSAVAGLLLAPTVHRVMHRVHWDDQP